MTRLGLRTLGAQLTAGCSSPAGAADMASQSLSEQGFCMLQPDALAKLCEVPTGACAAAASFWEALPPDGYLRDGGHYRSRRHGSFIQHLDASGAAPDLEQMPQRAHYQPSTFNALHGGLVRWYPPLDGQLVAMPCFRALVTGLGRVFARQRPVRQWFVEAHQFRIDTHGGVGRPTPEGAHRDGVDFVGVVLVQRHGIRGAETRVFELDGPYGVRFTLDQPWSALLMDDTRVIHETTPITPINADASGWRDTLVLTYRATGFMDPPG
ncbi:2OG-Fe dioxygenase family protein [Thiomonas sp. FB-Cd]|uniref:2OG-Fe dioxygenase family protein n=1 Tax=Thiomonas sp. FB-Cd TaxID=1158292 RepID=UPI000B1A4D65|nr:2OG-Fe dioxygenase family protein [Thiomonas sp. FB-Cd]